MTAAAGSWWPHLISIFSELLFINQLLFTLPQALIAVKALERMIKMPKIGFIVL